MTDLAEYIAGIARSSDDMKRDFGMAGSITNYVNLYNESITVTDPYAIVNTRGLGSSFILGHSGRGWIGAVKAASVACGSQPYLGDSRGAWATQRITSPNNTFIETFDGSRFIKAATGGTYTQNTTQSNLVADDYVYYPYAAWVRFNISAFSGKTINAASFFMKPDLVWSPAPANIDFWYTSIGSEYTESVPAFSLLLYSTGAKVTLANPWYNVGIWGGVNIKDVYDISQNKGSQFLTFKLRDSTLTTEGPYKGSAPAIRIGSYPTTHGSFVSCYDRTSSLNCPYLKIVWTENVGGTSASWGSGSLYFADGSQYETNSIYIGSSPVFNVKVNLAGSTYNNLQIQSSPNGVNWENCNSASVVPYNFTNVGSDLRLRFTASGGNAILNRYECNYGLV